jgi:hypothetical protein
MNSELERTEKKAVLALFRYCPSTCLEGLKKTTKYIRIASIRAEV